MILLSVHLPYLQENKVLCRESKYFNAQTVNHHSRCVQWVLNVEQEKEYHFSSFNFVALIAARKGE